jgi:hypothetical protein
VASSCGSFSEQMWLVVICFASSGGPADWMCLGRRTSVANRIDVVARDCTRVAPLKDAFPGAKYHLCSRKSGMNDEQKRGIITSVRFGCI